MVHSAASFGSSSTSDNIEELHALLHADALAGWQRRNVRESAPLDDWIRDNVVHAMASCPKVLAHWRKSQPSAIVENKLYRYVGAALEHLPEAAKTRILSGLGTTEAEVGLRNFVMDKPSQWSALSPSWIGSPASALRALASDMGWHELRLMAQVSHSIARPEAVHWQEWVPYAHSIGVLQRSAKVLWEKRNPSEEGLQPVVKVGQAWARPEDMALAQSFCKHMVNYLYTLTPHPDAAPVPVELQERMDALVAVHAGLGMMSTLQKMVLSGSLPALEQQAPIELPELEM